METSSEGAWTAESSPAIDEPPVRASRSEKRCTSSHVRRTRARKRKASWRKRFVQRSGGIALPSDEEDDRDAMLLGSLAAGEILNATDNAKISPARPANVSQKKRRSMPRPSEVVPDLSDGSASDAGLSSKGKQVHKRRTKASEILLEFMSKHGEPQPVPPWKLAQEGHKLYNRYMLPPKEDRFMTQYRVPTAFMSRTFRTSFLVSRQGRKSKKKLGSAKKTMSTHMSEVEKSVRDSASPSDVDLDFWATTSDSGDEVQRISEIRKTPESRKKLQAILAEERRRQENAEIVAQMLAQHKSASDSSESHSCDSDQPLAPTLGPENSYGGNEEQDKDQEPENQDVDFFAELVGRVSQNASSLFEKEPKPDQQPKTGGSSRRDAQNHANEYSESKRAPMEKAKKLSKFAREKEKAALFADGVIRGKRRRGPFNESGLQLWTRAQDRRLNAEVRQIEIPNAKRIMEKMGFTGALGAKGQGIEEPLMPSVNVGRTGIGGGSSSTAIVGNRLRLPGQLSANALKDEIPSLGSSEPANVPSHASGVQVRTDRRLRAQGSKSTTEEIAVIEDEERGSTDVVSKDDDVYETDHQYMSRDNNRRAVLVDLDVLVKNSTQRRRSALQKMVVASGELDASVDIGICFAGEKRDLSDMECIQRILRFCSLDQTERKCSALQKELDAAYKAGERAELDGELLSALRLYAKAAYFGVFFRGSSGRLEDEMNDAGLSDSFLTSSTVCLKFGDTWPYINAWKELSCRVGVPACHSLCLYSGREEDRSSLAGEVASIVMGARAMQAVRLGESTEMRVQGSPSEHHDWAKVPFAAFRDDRATFCNRYIRKPMALPKRRRVLALCSSDGLWYSGVEVYASRQPPGSSQQSLIRFHGFDKQEWVGEENSLPLERRKFRSLRDAGFPGSLDADDVDDL